MSISVSSRTPQCPPSGSGPSIPKLLIDPWSVDELRMSANRVEEPIGVEHNNLVSMNNRVEFVGNDNNS